MIHRLFDLGRRRPRATAFAFLFLVFALAMAALSLRVDTSAEGVLLDNDPDRATRDFARATFGTLDEVIVVMVEPPDVYAPEAVAALRRLTDALQRVPGVAEVLSLTSLEIPKKGWAMEISPIAGTPFAPVTGDALRREVARFPIVTGNLVSADGRAAAANVLLKEYGADGAALTRAVAGIREAAQAWDGPGRVTVAGIPVTKVEIASLMHRDLIRLTPVTIVLIVFLLFATFRTARGVWLPLLVIAAGEVMALGLASFTGRTVSVVSVVIPSVVLAIGCSYAVHLFPALSEDGRRIRTQVTVFLSALTATVGYLSLLTSPIHTIRDHGIFAAIGVGCMYAATFLLLPALDRIFPGEVRDRAPVIPGARVLGRLAEFVIARPRTLLVSALLLTAVSLLGLLRVRVETDYLAYFPSSHPVRGEIARVNDRLSGSIPMMVMVDAGRDGAFDDPAMLRSVVLFQRALERIPGIDKTMALPDLLSLVHRSMQGEETARLWVPEQAGEATQVMQLIEFGGRKQTLAHYVDEHRRIANVFVRADLISSGDLSIAIAKIREEGRSMFGHQASVVPTGTMQVLNKTSGTIARGVVSSLGLAVFVITAIMILHLRSWKLGFLAMVPNLLPIGLLFGTMGALGVTLSTGTSIAASIALGMIVDETIHFIGAYTARRREGLSAEASIREVFARVGPPIVWAALILAAGFAVLLLSAFLPLVWLGVFMAVTIVVSLLSDLVILPAILLLVDRGE